MVIFFDWPTTPSMIRMVISGPVMLVSPMRSDLALTGTEEGVNGVIQVVQPIPGNISIH